MTGERTRYAYGRAGQTPELEISRRFGAGAEFTPWPGVGGSIWESIRFTNSDVIYEVYAGLERFAAVEDSPEFKEHPQFGGILVLDSDESEIAHFKCIPRSVLYNY